LSSNINKNNINKNKKSWGSSIINLVDEKEDAQNGKHKSNNQEGSPLLNA